MAAPKNDGLVKNTCGMKPKGVIFKKKKEKNADSVSFKRRKDCIKKKTMELSILCGVKACAVIVGPDGKLETWPENRVDVLELIRAFQKTGSNGSVKLDGRAMKTSAVVEAENDDASMVEDDHSLCEENCSSAQENQKLIPFADSVEKEEQGRFRSQHQEELGYYSIMLNADEEDLEFVSMLEEQLLAGEQSSPPAHENQESVILGSPAEQEKQEGVEFNQQEKLGHTSTVQQYDGKEVEFFAEVDDPCFPGEKLLMPNENQQLFTMISPVEPEKQTTIGNYEKDLEEVDGWFKFEPDHEEEEEEEDDDESFMSYLLNSAEKQVEQGMEFDADWFKSDWLMGPLEQPVF